MCDESFSLLLLLLLRIVPVDWKHNAPTPSCCRHLCGYLRHLDTYWSHHSRAESIRMTTRLKFLQTLTVTVLALYGTAGAQSRGGGAVTSGPVGRNICDTCACAPDNLIPLTVNCTCTKTKVSDHFFFLLCVSFIIVVVIIITSVWQRNSMKQTSQKNTTPLSRGGYRKTCLKTTNNINIKIYTHRVSCNVFDVQTSSYEEETVVFRYFHSSPTFHARCSHGYVYR